MSKSFQKEKPPARINLFLEVDKGDAKEKLELPQRMLMVGDYTGREDDTPVSEREVVNINKDNFESVMKAMNLEANMTVKDRLKPDSEDDLKVNLRFEDMSSFSPEEVAKQVPELNRLVAMRNLLQDLRNRVVSMSQFRKQLETIVKDKDSLDKLTQELDRLVSQDAQADQAQSEDGADVD